MRFLHQQGWTNYVLIWAAWWFAWFFPQLAGDWYDSQPIIFGTMISIFHICQAIIPAILIFLIFRLTNEYWRVLLGMVLVLQIVHNLGDVYFDSDWLQYNAKQIYLNHIEQAIIGIGGGLTLLYRTTKALRNRADKSDRNRHNPHHRVLASQSGITGHD